jgi:hypothetical protein
MTRPLNGVKHTSVVTLPSAASSSGKTFEQGGTLWFSNGTSWFDLNASGGGGSGPFNVDGGTPSSLPVVGLEVDGGVP